MCLLQILRSAGPTFNLCVTLRLVVHPSRHRWAVIFYLVRADAWCVWNITSFQHGGWNLAVWCHAGWRGSRSRAKLGGFRKDDVLQKRNVYLNNRPPLLNLDAQGATRLPYEQIPISTVQVTLASIFATQCIAEPTIVFPCQEKYREERRED